MKLSSASHLDSRFLHDLTTTVWPGLGVTLDSEFTDRLSQRRFGDGVIVNTSEGRRRIDWKASQVEYASFPVELLQDWQSFDIGWFYTLQCDEIWFGHYVLDALRTVDVINFPALKQLPHDAANGARPQLSDKGQGHTIFVPLQLGALRRLGVSQCVYNAQAVCAESF
jgi:hypothetical protein